MTNYFPNQDKIRDEFTKYDTDKNGVITRGLDFLTKSNRFWFRNNFVPQMKWWKRSRSFPKTRYEGWPDNTNHFILLLTEIRCWKVHLPIRHWWRWKGNKHWKLIKGHQGRFKGPMNHLYFRFPIQSFCWFGGTELLAVSSYLCERENN